MNLLASYNWIREYVSLKQSPEDFARRISLSGPAVERLHPQAPPYDRMVVGQILEVKAHPNPKVTKLRIVSTDIGTGSPLVLVCGGSNLEQGMKVAVALVGAKVKWHGQGDLIELQPAVIQGIESKGMICGANEIGLADAFPHAEREILDLSWLKAKAGTPLAKALDLDDTVFDIEVTTNRPDAYCMVGLAREAAAVFDAKFLWREPVLPALPKGAIAKPLTVKVEERTLCTRYQAVVMSVDLAAAPQSPWWMKRRLIQSGSRPINVIVDITNYVMLEYGQPMHAFDYDKLGGQAIVVRLAKEKEGLKLLDGTERKLASTNLVIADDSKPVAVAGVMGGEDSGVSDATTTIVFESATFDPVSVRRTGRSLNLQSDSSLRFEKGLPEDLTQAALARAVELCQQVVGGKVASKVFDIRASAPKKVRYSFRPRKAEELIGVPMPRKDMVATLKSLGFGVAGSGKSVMVTVPYWRQRDIEGERDLVEEIARIHGYVNLPSVMPTGEIPTGAGDPALDAEERVKFFLRGAGYTELLNYSLVPKWHFEKSGLDSAKAVRIINPLSADFEYLRTSLVPGMLQTISENQGLFTSGRVFEVSKAYHSHPDALPNERTRVAIAVYDHSVGSDDSLFRIAKGTLESLAAEWGIAFGQHRPQNSQYWHPGRSVQITEEGVELGTLGEIHPSVLAKFGIDGRVAAFELDLADFLARPRHHAAYVPIPMFPPVKRDLALIVAESVEYGDLYVAFRNGSALLKEVELFDVYRGKGIDDGKKSVAMHLTFSTNERTLTAEEIDAEIAALTEVLGEKFVATVRT